MERSDKKSSVLIAAATEKAAAQVKSILPANFGAVSWQPSMAKIKQSLSMAHYDMLLILTPLADDFGLQSALDIVDKFPDMGILLMVPKEACEQTVYRVGESGIMVLARPFSVQSFQSALQIQGTLLRRIRSLTEENQKLRRKLEDERYVARAKVLLVERQGMSEQEAHKYLEQEAMNHSITRRESALQVIRQAGRILITKN